MNPKLQLGQMAATPNALDNLSQGDIASALERHQSGDWGNLDQDDWNANNHALAQGMRIISQYCTVTGLKFWIITEADRSKTTVLLPEDY